MRILFLCVANSARSQLAEGLGKKWLVGHEVLSAGSQPTKINPHAVRAMEEIGIDTSGLFAKSMSQIDLNLIDLVITLCAEEYCPSLPGLKKLHWPIPDPASESATDAESLTAFRAAREIIQKKIWALAVELGNAKK